MMGQIHTAPYAIEYDPQNQWGGTNLTGQDSTRQEWVAETELCVKLKLRYVYICQIETFF